MRLILLFLAGVSIASAQMNGDPWTPKSPSTASAGATAYDGAKVIANAEKELGVFKQPGSDDKRVKQYTTETYNNDDVYSNDGWCSAFVSFILKESGYKWSPNNTDYGWMFVVNRVSAKDVKPGDIAMLDSHIAFYLGQKVNGEGNTVVGLLGGNQDYQVCVMWIPVEDIEYYAEGQAAPADWMPEKHIPNGTTGSGAGAGINVLDDSKVNLRWTQPAVHHTANGHPL